MIDEHLVSLDPPVRSPQLTAPFADLAWRRWDGLSRDHAVSFNECGKGENSYSERGGLCG